LKRDFTKLLDISRKEGEHLLKRAHYLKKHRNDKRAGLPLAGKSLAMIFEKASTRTRLSFEVGMRELGGHAVFLSPGETQIGRGEPVRDTARVLSRYVDAIMARTYLQDVVEELARWATVPVINGLSDLYHPCQILADLFTIEEYKGDFRDIKIAYVGDGNNVANSWLEASILFNLDFTIATPAGYRPAKDLLGKAAGNRRFHIVTDPRAAAEGADVIYTDVWVSMGQESEKKKRRRNFAGYRIDEKLLKPAKRNVIVMHCLPAYRGEEISEDVFEKYNGVIFTQAENRLHVQKALLEWLIKSGS
jgi:ornithine carbamoyltransferase